MEGSCKTRVCVGSLGLSFAITWTIIVVLSGVLAATLDYGEAWMTLLSSVYLGFDETVKGIAIGAVWAFVDGLIFGVLIAFFYNLVAKCCKCKICSGNKDKTP